MHITNYYIIRADRMLELQEEVNKMIADGWQPVGGIAIVHLPRNDDNLNDDAWWVQAMGVPATAEP